MSVTLVPGANTTLPTSTGTLTIEHDLDSGIDVNLTAFLITEAGKVKGDCGVVYFNNPVHESGATTFVEPVRLNGTVKHQINFDLAKLPADIHKIGVTLTEDKDVGFSQVRNLRARIQMGESVNTLEPGQLKGEKGVIVAELYKRNGEAKVRSVWQGFSTGLEGLCGYYGVEVSEGMNEPETTPPPAPSAGPKRPISLEKPDEKHKISLEKGASAPKKITISATWIDNGDGKDNDDLDLRVGILLPDGRMKIIQAPDRAGSFNREPYVLHTGDVTGASATAPGIETVEVNPEISKLYGGKVALVLSVYSALANGAVSVASLMPKMKMQYGEQIVECAYTFKNDFNSYSIYTYVIGLIEIDSDSISLSPSGVTSRKGSEATPWLTWERGQAKLTMNGPPVFKGQPLRSKGLKSYS